MSDSVRAGLAGPAEGVHDPVWRGLQRLLAWLYTTVANIRGYNGLTLATVGYRLRDSHLAARR